MSLPGDGKTQKSPGLPGVLSSEQIPLAPPWGVQPLWPSSLWASVSLFPLPEGGVEGLQRPGRQLPCSWVRREGSGMTSCVSSLPPGCRWEGSVCSGTRASSIWRARNWPSQPPRAFPSLPHVSISPRRLGCTPGAAREGWAGTHFGAAPQLCLGGLENRPRRRRPAPLMSGCAPSPRSSLRLCRRRAFVGPSQESWCVCMFRCGL